MSADEQVPSVRIPAPLPDGVSQATVGVRGGLLRSGFEETAEAMFLTSGYVYESAADAEKAAAAVARTQAATAQAKAAREREELAQRLELEVASPPPPLSARSFGPRVPPFRRGRPRPAPGRR